MADAVLCLCDSRDWAVYGFIQICNSIINLRHFEIKLGSEFLVSLRNLSENVGRALTCVFLSSAIPVAVSMWMAGASVSIFYNHHERRVYGVVLLPFGPGSHVLA